MRKTRLGQTLLLIGALALAVVGQYYFAKKPNYFWDGVAFYALAVILFLILVRQPAPAAAPAEARPLRLTREILVRGGLITAGVILGLAAVLQLTDPHENYWPILWTWIAGMAAYLLGFLHLPTRGDGGEGDRQGGDRKGLPLLQKVRTDGWEWGLVALLLVGAFLLRVWWVDTIPWTLGGDEGNQGLWARDALTGRLSNMFSTGWLSVPNVSFYWQAAWLKLFGDDTFGLRLPWTVVGAFTVLGAYLLVRRLFDRPLALLTAFLLATYHFHIHYSRLGSVQVADAFFVVWTIYFMVVGWQRNVLFRGSKIPDRGGGRRWPWAVSGVIAGLAFYFYAGSRQVPVVLIAVLIWAALTERGFLRKHQGDLLAMLGGFLIAVGPMGLFALKYPNEFNARVNQVGIFQSGWLAKEVVITGRSQWQLLAEQFRKSFFAFNFYKDRVVWYSADIPLMDFLASILFVFGAVFSAVRFIWPHAEPARPAVSTAGRPAWRYGMFATWFTLVILLGGVLTENPPSSMRLVSSAVPAVFFVAVALRELGRVLHNLLASTESRWAPQSLPCEPALSLSKGTSSLEGRPVQGDSLRLAGLAQRLVIGVLALVLALTSVRYYFGPYQDLWIYGSFNGEVATRLGYYLRDLGPEWQEYFFGAPRMYADFGSTPFIAKEIKLYDVKEPLTRPPTFVDRKYKAVFVFLPERAHELALVKQLYPNGVQEEVRRIDRVAPKAVTLLWPETTAKADREKPLLFVAYKVENPRQGVEQP
jgi:4-amino-4-deoxy-L-arabinose transferase-like glycosyltransferase